MGQKCSNCMADFESPEADLPCPKPSPGREYVDCGKGNHMFNAGHDSDWFAGLCPCNDYPCKRAVAAQKLLEAEEKVRGDIIKLYYIQHKSWPQGEFVDGVIRAVHGTVNDEELNAKYLQACGRGA
jgi:hypothetical protein